MERLAQKGPMVKRLVSPRKQQVTVVKNRGIVENKKKSNASLFFAGPSQAEMEKQMKAKIAATTAYLNKEREQEEARKRKEGIEEKMGKGKMKKEEISEDKRQRENMMKEVEKAAEEKRHKENMKKVEKESSMEDFKRLQAQRREAEGRR